MNAEGKLPISYAANDPEILGRTVEQLLAQTPDKPVRHVCRGQLANTPERATNDYTGREVADIGEALKTNYLLTHADALQVKAYSNGGS